MFVSCLAEAQATKKYNFHPGSTIMVGKTKIDVLHTPGEKVPYHSHRFWLLTTLCVSTTGHSAGSVCLKVTADGQTTPALLISGSLSFLIFAHAMRAENSLFFFGWLAVFDRRRRRHHFPRQLRSHRSCRKQQRFLLYSLILVIPSLPP